MPEEQQPVKPVTYSVVKTGLIGLTRYLSTYWTANNIRVNAISPGGVFNGQPTEFTDKLHALIPMARMAHKDEYQGAVLFLCSDASSYMTGQNLIVDGGRDGACRGRAGSIYLVGNFAVIASIRQMGPPS